MNLSGQLFSIVWRRLPPVLILLLTCANLAASAPSFVSAKPIWPKGRETEKNLFVGFHAGFKAPAPGEGPAARHGRHPLSRLPQRPFPGPRPGPRPARLLPRGRMGPHGQTPARRKRGRLRGGGLQRQQLLPARPAVVPPGGSRRGRQGARLDRRQRRSVHRDHSQRAGAEGAALQLSAPVLGGVSACPRLRPLAQRPGFGAGRGQSLRPAGQGAAAPPRRLSRLRRPPAFLARLPGPGPDRPQSGPALEGPLAHRHRPQARRLPGEGPGDHPLPRTANHRQRHQPARQSALDTGRAR